MDPHKQQQHGAIARTAKEWATAVRNESTIPSGVRTRGNFHHLVVSDCHFDNSASGISHAEYLHLRTIWYHYEEKHVESFAGLFKDNPKTGYKGFVSPRADNLAREAMEKMSDPFKYYLGEFNKTNAHQWYFHPSANCGHYAMVRYWQVMTAAHVKGIGASIKVFKPQLRSNTTAANDNTTAANDNTTAANDNTTAANDKTTDRPQTPPDQKISESGSPSKSGTPATKSHPAARGTAENLPSADEAYVNTALLLLLQAVTQDFRHHVNSLHWVPPRMALRHCDWDPDWP